jgi:molybdenum cofactor biosynthesis enzyme MoaA
LIAEAIREVRSQTGSGTINLNSNAGNFDAIQRIVDAGLDSIRVSLFSADPEHYSWYHRPRGYQLADVVKSLRYAAEHGVNVAINLLFYPGFTNQQRETEALYQLLASTGVTQVQLRNLNLDPEKLTQRLVEEELVTIETWIAELKRRFPKLQVGNYSIPVR